MSIVVIGGQSRNIGKTSVVCGLIAALPDRRWTAIKITQCQHDAAELCDGGLAGRSVAIDEERDAAAATDSSRYLAAGALRSLWVRTLRGQLAEAMERIRAEMDASANVILESNSVLEFLKPDVYALVLDPSLADFKASARMFLGQADAILIPASSMEQRGADVSAELIRSVRTFRVELPSYVSPEFAAFVASKLGD